MTGAFLWTLPATAKTAPKITDWFQEGLNLLEAGLYDEAIRAFSITLEVMPQDHQAYNNRGAAWFYKKKYQKALADYNRAIQLNSEYIRAFYNRGAAFFYLQDLDLAQKDFSRVIELAPLQAEAYLNRGVIFLMQKRHKQAIADLEKLLELEPGHPEGIVKLTEAKAALTTTPSTTLLAKRAPAIQAETPNTPAEKTASLSVEPEERIEKQPTDKPPADMPAPHKDAIPPVRIVERSQGFTVQIGSYYTEQLALDLSRIFREKGWTSFVGTHKKATIPNRYRVHAGTYATLTQAVQKAKQLKHVKPRVDTWSARRKFSLAIPKPQDHLQRASIKERLLANGLGQYLHPETPEDHPGHWILGAFKDERQARLFRAQMIRKWPADGLAPPTENKVQEADSMAKPEPEGPLPPSIQIVERRQPFTIQIGSFLTEKLALQLSKKYRDQGLGCFIGTYVKKNGQTRFRVHAGVYPTMAQAKQKSKGLSNMQPQVATWPVQRKYSIAIVKPKKEKQRKSLEAFFEANGYRQYLQPHPASRDLDRWLMGAFAQKRQARLFKARLEKKMAPYSQAKRASF